MRGRIPGATHRRKGESDAAAMYDVQMRRQFGLGLRAQILFALSATFAIAFLLLSMAMGQLSRRRATIELRSNAARVGHLVTDAVSVGGGEAFRRVSERALRGQALVAIEVRTPRGERLFAGAIGDAPPVRVEREDGSRFRVWPRAETSHALSPTVRLMLLYGLVTGAAILLLAYFSLTTLIVRPVESLTRASERMAGGRLEAEVPVSGAAEVARLATSFNQMAFQLRADQRALEERLNEVERTKSELESTQDQLVRSAKMASVGRISAGIAHEIGNPLTAILGLVELVRGGGLSDDEAGEFLGRVQSETERIHRIIRELLAFARQGEGAASMDEPVRAVDAREVIEDAIHLVAPKRALEGATIKTLFDDDAPPVLAHRERLNQVVLNLLLNAADALDGKGTIRVTVRAGSVDGEVCIAVEDDGPGVASEILDHLFEPFVTTKPTGEGTGLGLAVCHTLVERMGGSIRAENLAEGGARFEVTLPMAEPGVE